jgi:hypothetical protein
MKISAGQAPGAPVEPPNTLPKQVKTDDTSASSLKASSAEPAGAGKSTSGVTPLQRQTDVTLRRDTNGRVYYVVSDAKSGQEIIEVPPKALRDVSQGIADYLKEEESKASSHVEVKA